MVLSYKPRTDSIESLHGETFTVTRTTHETVSAICTALVKQDWICRAKETDLSFRCNIATLFISESPPEHEFRVSLAKVLLECSTTNDECSEKVGQLYAH